MKTEILNTSRADLPQVDHRNIIVEENFNKRGIDNYGDIEGLARNIVENGVLEALIGFKVRGEDKYVLTEGHRRLKAIQLAFQFHKEGKAGFENIDKILRIPLRPGSSDKKERLLVMAITGNGKVPLTDMEKAELYNELIELEVQAGVKRGEAIKILITKLGVSQATVYNVLKLNELPEEIKESILRKEISGATVVAIVREVKDVDEQKRLVKEAITSAKSSTEKVGKKATAAHVKGLKAKSAIQRLKELSEKLEEKEINNVRSRVLNDLIEALETKMSTKDMIDLFIPAQ